MTHGWRFCHRSRLRGNANTDGKAVPLMIDIGFGAL
jgi:hypothetical protein